MPISEIRMLYKKKKVQKRVTTGIIIGFITGFLLVFKQLIASCNYIISNEYLRYRMFRLITLSLQDSLYKWLMVTIGVSLVFLIIVSLWEFLFSVKIQRGAKTKHTLKIILITIGCLVLFFLTRKSMSLPGSFHPISVSAYMGLFLFTVFLWWILIKIRWNKLLTRQRINVIKRIVYILVLALAVSSVVVAIKNKLYFPKGPNVLLIGIDTLRADHLSCYMYTRETSPAIDNLAREGILFSKCISHIPITTPSFSTILTSKRPISHGVLDNNYNDYKLDDWHITLSEVLKNMGYNTAAFVSGWTMKKDANLTQGFDVYNDDFEKDRKAEQVNQHVFRWLEENKYDRFFLFIHYFDPHGKYQPDSPYDSYFNYTTEEGDISKIPSYQRDGTIADPSFYIAMYDGEISYTDYYIGQVLEKLSQLDLYHETIIIITADHGETMAEHLRWFDHGSFLYEEQVHVPLLIWYPQMLRPKKINTLVRLEDIFPTILDFLGIHFSKNIEGQSLLPLIRGEIIKDRDMYLESSPGILEKDRNVIEGIRGKKFAIRSEGWKLIRTLKTSGLYYELYNLKEDPKELHNQIGTNPAVEDLLKKKLEKFIKIYKSSPYYLKKADSLPLQEKISNKKLKEMLKSLGYIH